MTKVTRGVLFDLDGTLLHSAPDLARAAEQAALQYALPVRNLDTIHHCVSQGARGMLAHITQQSNGDSFEQALASMLSSYEVSCYVASSLYQGVVEVLAELAARRIPWGIVTNKSRRFTKPIVDAVTELQAAQVCICPEDVVARKPHPDGIKKACAALECLPYECWYVGDDIKDMQASHAAECEFAFAAYGYAQHSPAGVVTLRAPLDFLNLL